MFLVRRDVQGAHHQPKLPLDLKLTTSDRCSLSYQLLASLRSKFSQMMLLLTTDCGNNCQCAGCRQEAPPAEPVPPKSSFKNLLFRQSKSGDILIVSRTLTARMAAPHTLQLDHLKLSSCCLIEGEEHTERKLLIAHFQPAAGRTLPVGQNLASKRNIVTDVICCASSDCKRCILGWSADPPGVF